MNYQKKFDHSFTLGAYPTFELLEKRPDEVRVIYLHPRANEEIVEKVQELSKQHKIEISDSPRFFSALKKDNVFLAAKFTKYESTLEDEDHLLLHEPEVLGNLGTILRSALAFGIKDVAIIGPSCDVFHPNCIRASMGAHFSLRIKSYSSMDAYQQQFKRPIYAFMTGDHPYLTQQDYEDKISLLFGSESSGLPQEFEHRFHPTKIKMSTEVDSLNLSLAVGIALHHLYVGKG